MNRAEFISEILAPVATNTYPPQELEFILSVFERLRPARVFEWGTNVGKSAWIFRKVARYLGLSVQIYSIDLPASAGHYEHAKSLTGSLVHGFDNIFLFTGDGLNKTLDLCRDLQSARCLVFIDGDHYYESVLRDLIGIVFGMPEADILLHDTGIAPEGQNNGPYLAIQTVLAAHPWYDVERTAGFPGMTLLRRKPCSQTRS